MKNYLLAILAVFSCLLGYAQQPLIVSYATTYLNQVPNAVSGILITPSGQVLKTAPMGPFTQSNLVVDPPEIGTYQAYYEVQELGSFRICPIVGGIVATLANHPETPLSFNPSASHIQAYGGKVIQVGATSEPTASFAVTQEDLQ